MDPLLELVFWWLLFVVGGGLLLASPMLLFIFICTLKDKLREKSIDKSKTKRTEQRGVVTSKIIKRHGDFHTYTVAVRTNSGAVYRFTGEYDYHKVREGESVTVVCYQEYTKFGRKLKPYRMLMK